MTDIARRLAQYFLELSAAVELGSSMKPTRTTHKANLETLPRMPSWVTSVRGETLEDVAFLSGAPSFICMLC